MTKYSQSPFDGHREVVATLSGRVIEASLEELRLRDELTLAFRSLLRQGMTVDELSAASGYSPGAIRKMVDRNLHLSEDLDTLTGVV